MEYVRIDEYIKAIQASAKDKLYIVGAGKYGKRLGEYLNKYKIPWEGYIDKKIMLQQINGKNVYPYEKVGDGYYAISTYIYKQEVEDELKKRNIESKKIITYSDQKIMERIYDDLIDWEKYERKIKRFQEKHKDERCFIIGNGPSLRIDDLEKIEKDISFASNSIFAIYPYTRWRPNYYCISDGIFCKEMMTEKENMRILMNGCNALFTSIYHTGIQYKDDEEINHIYYIKLLKDESQKGVANFSSDCSEKVCLGGTVTYVMLQLAVYMGFKKIYLLGMDFSYTVERHYDNTITKNNVCNHMNIIEEEEKRFYDAVTKVHGVPYIADVDKQLASYQTAKQYADAHGIKIYNATRGGKLEVFPRVDFDSLFD